MYSTALHVILYITALSVSLLQAGALVLFPVVQIWFQLICSMSFSHETFSLLSFRIYLTLIVHFEIHEEPQG